MREFITEKADEAINLAVDDPGYAPFVAFLGNSYQGIEPLPDPEKRVAREHLYYSIANANARRGYQGLEEIGRFAYDWLLVRDE